MEIPIFLLCWEPIVQRLHSDLRNSNSTHSSFLNSEWNSGFRSVPPFQRTGASARRSPALDFRSESLLSGPQSDLVGHGRTSFARCFFRWSCDMLRGWNLTSRKTRTLPREKTLPSLCCRAPQRGVIKRKKVSHENKQPTASISERRRAGGQRRQATVRIPFLYPSWPFTVRRIAGG
jgi:hypothetical protein